MRLERASRLAAEADSHYKFNLRKAQQDSYYSDIRRKTASTMVETDHNSRIRHSSAKRTTAVSYHHAGGAATDMKQTSPGSFRCDCNSVRRTRSPLQDLAYYRRPPSPIRRSYWYCHEPPHQLKPSLYQSASQAVLPPPQNVTHLGHNYRPGGSPLRQSASPARSHGYHSMAESYHQSADRIARLQEIERAEYRYRYRLAQA